MLPYICFFYYCMPVAWRSPYFILHFLGVGKRPMYVLAALRGGQRVTERQPVSHFSAYRHLTSSFIQVLWFRKPVLLLNDFTNCKAGKNENVVSLFLMIVFAL